MPRRPLRWLGGHKFISNLGRPGKRRNLEERRIFSVKIDILRPLFMATAHYAGRRHDQQKHGQVRSCPRASSRYSLPKPYLINQTRVAALVVTERQNAPKITFFTAVSRLFYNVQLS